MKNEDDPLSDLLRVLRVNGALVLHDSYAPPWSVSVPDSATLAQICGLSATDRVVAFHLVQQGRLELTPIGGTPTEANAGDLLIAFGGQPHQLSCGAGTQPIPLARLLKLPHNSTDTRSLESGYGHTRLLCGVFGLGDLEGSPLVRALPTVAHIPSGASDTLDALVSVLASEADHPRPGSGFAVGRVLELLCSEALRHIGPTSDPVKSTWLRALAGPAVNAAMSAVHREPGRDWTVRRLANEALLSPSRLTVGFRLAVGQSPMSYVGQWRMLVAARLLRDGDAQIQQVAEHVGYTSQASFSRAFQRSHGLAPREYRTIQTSGRHVTAQ